MQSLPQQISQRTAAIALLKDSISIAQNPPSLKIDKSAYEPLDRIEALLKSAKSADEAKALIKTLNDEIAVEEQAIAQLEKDLADAESRITPSITQAKEFAAQAHNHYAAYLDAIQKLYETSQKMASDRTLIYGENAKPLGVGEEDRLWLSRGIAYKVSADGSIRPELDLFVLGF